MVDAGEINEAENRLYDLISATDMNSLEVAILFYSYLNDKTDDFLEANDFTGDIPVVRCHKAALIHPAAYL